jgi:hypothetical protein
VNRYRALYWPDPHGNPERQLTVEFDHPDNPVTQAVCKAAAQAADVPSWQVTAIGLLPGTKIKPIVP